MVTVRAEMARTTAWSGKVEQGLETDGEARSRDDRANCEQNSRHEPGAIDGVMAQRQDLAGVTQDHFFVRDRAPEANRVDRNSVHGGSTRTVERALRGVRSLRGSCRLASFGDHLRGV